MREARRITFGEGIESERKQDYRPTLSRGPRSSRGHLVAKCHEDINIAACQLAKGGVIRFPPLAAFVRRPGDVAACGEISDGAGIRNPSH
jgi:hypothetical protein